GDGAGWNAWRGAGDGGRGGKGGGRDHRAFRPRGFLRLSQAPCLRLRKTGDRARDKPREGLTEKRPRSIRAVGVPVISSVEDVADALERERYVADRSLAVTLFLALRLATPLFVH